MVSKALRVGVASVYSTCTQLTLLFREFLDVSVGELINQRRPMFSLKFGSGAGDRGPIGASRMLQPIAVAVEVVYPDLPVDMLCYGVVPQECKEVTSFAVKHSFRSAG